MQTGGVVVALSSVSAMEEELVVHLPEFVTVTKGI